MAAPTRIETLRFLFPVGSTPAVCLTQSLPPDQDAALLLLGCGDVRNILYTSYADSGNDRKLDITCCDIEVEIIARNILFYTLLVDDTERKNTDKIWNLYYHFSIDSDSLHLLRDQADQLQKLASTIEEWNDGKYGHLLRFCDTNTFSKVVGLWKFYSLQPSHGEAFEEQQARLERGIQKARKIKETVVGNSFIFSGIRSAAPCASHALQDLPQSHKIYWDNGTATPGLAQSTESQQINPMFGTLDDNLVIHYGADPRLGFHLATTYAPLVKHSPLAPNGAGSEEQVDSFPGVQAQFNAYTQAFQSFAGRLTIRFVNSDALALCHTLQHVREHGKSKNARWYCSPYSYTPLFLDSNDYSPQGSKSEAPLSFDIIDTSNLMDYVGCLNFLAAASPLLNPSPSSTLFTETLGLQEKSVEMSARKLLYDDLLTIALFFGLIPLQCWTGVSTTSIFDEELANSLHLLQETTSCQSRYVFQWKSLDFTSRRLVSFDPIELASLLYRVYVSLFDDARLEQVWKMKADDILRLSYATYTRTSFAAIIGLIRREKLVEWETFMPELYRLILNDSTLHAGSHYLQDLGVQLHLQGLYNVPTLELSPQELDEIQANPQLGQWTSVPAVVCLTMVIPRERFAEVFGSHMLGGSSSLAVQIRLQSAQQMIQNYFPALQLSFGRLKTTGIRYAESFAVEVEEDPRQWDAAAPLIASVMVPSWEVFSGAGLSKEVVFALKETPVSMAKFSGKLGKPLEITKSTLAGDDVFITKHQPNMHGDISSFGMFAVASPMHPAELSNKSPSDVSSRIHIALASEEMKFTSITTHLDIAPGPLQDRLRAGGAIHVSLVSPFEIAFAFDSDTPIQNVRLPVPVRTTGSKTKVSRKSSYIELTAPVVSQTLLASRPDSFFSMSLHQGVPVIGSTHYVSLDRLPIIAVNNQAGAKLLWFIPHLSSMFSAQERTERGRLLHQSRADTAIRVNFKDSLFSMFLQFTEDQNGVRQSIFAVKGATTSSVEILIFVADLRLDISNQTVVLDAAAIPMYDELKPQLKFLLSTLGTLGVVAIVVDDKELLAWKHALPVFTERCRDWEHIPSCSYAVSGKVPVSVEEGKEVLCACGRGKFPDGYGIPQTGAWGLAMPHATRMAIPLCFPVPFIDRPFSLRDLKTEQGGTEESLARRLEIELRQRIEEEEKKREGSCRRCGQKESERGTTLFRCGACKRAEYCSKDCQKKDWTAHKAQCKFFQQG
ncbi:hypothetical protein ASPZODRAFT_62802 [Penicilliopsis zonata CBS 506.65]|uniref:MYND-type domain-containing protein n=1 Tax=Penicilliopsis zonata CBS 506.65 TaxID=1073090 RepID=A0A1L9SNN5_9EURO|nr:hypothetical protein ASPZODRAFT_62802 [Penicilliopsis zonata CBS 506.65]OJJ48721.1 hypothetical protein ASPZODRAFT_62802 [Penicilliopsis zonata CBS 506.65]